MGGSSKKKRSKKQLQNEEEEGITETRFAAAETHPQFRPLKPKESKVVLDDRFSSVLTDPRFQLEGRDKYGRKGKKANKNVKEELSSFYMVEEKENDEEEKKKKEEEKQPEESSSEDDSDSDDSDSGSKDEEDKDKTKEDPASRIAYLTALSRGELDASSSSDDDDSSQSSGDDDDEEEEDEKEDPVYGNAGILDPSTKEEDEVEISFESSPYLVVQNMDWEHIRAVDLFSLLSSFTTMGAVKRVQVFQSDFGKERMEKDRLQGPTGIWKKGTKPTDSTKKISEEESDEESTSKNENDDNSSQEGSDDEDMKEEEELPNDNDFDPEKLRAYEASKLKYFFAIVEFTSAEYADVAYREVDGMEFERSSSAIDLRTLPQEAYQEVVEGRYMRDEATSVPGNYEPPEFVVSALQQSSVECTWDQGDVERERKLTQYNRGGWQNMTETDDLQAYLASDGSSDDDSEAEERTKKGSAMRKLLGLDSGSEGGDKSGDGSSDDSGSDDDSDSEDKGMSKEIKYIPGQADLGEKIRSKLKEKDETKEELTPWEKYLEKRKQKRRERRQAARGRKDEPEEGRSTLKQKLHERDDDESEESGGADNDDFFAESDDDKPKKKQTKSKRGKSSQAASKSQAANTAELELLLAGDNDEEQEKDFDIRGLQRIEKNKGKKLKGGRKRKEEKITKDVSGTNFKVDVEDSRFAAVLDGTDGRFGIDKTDPNYKDTAAMRDILAEQTKRRKKKRQKTKPSSSAPAPDVSADSNAKTLGSNALSSLVQRLKTKVANQ